MSFERTLRPTETPSQKMLSSTKIRPHFPPGRIYRPRLSVCPVRVCRNAATASTTSSSVSTPLSVLPPPPPPPTSAYIHLPFCLKRCHYCDFPIIALGSATSPTSDPRFSNYNALLLREIRATRPKSDSHPPLKTIYFGGGTPSLFPPALVSSLLDAVAASFCVEDDAEVSMEMDPGTFDEVALRELVGMGVNRVSLGVQAFQEELLRVCGRSHGLREVEEAIGVVKGENRLVNWSMDLISSLPNQSLEMWEESLRRVVDAGPTHVSIYDLQVEQGTKFGKLYTPGEFPLPSETQSANLYEVGAATLRAAGYEHYEISSYSRSGFQCRHNLTYWGNRPYYAFGLGAASYVNGTRFSRPRRMRDYAQYVEDLEEEGAVLDHHTNGACGGGGLDARDVAMDVVMLSLRTARGLDLKRFVEDFGMPLAASLCQAFEPYLESGHVVALDRSGRPIPSNRKLHLEDDGSGSNPSFVRLTDPEGFLLSNELISTAFRTIRP